MEYIYTLRFFRMLQIIVVKSYTSTGSKHWHTNNSECCACSGFSSLIFNRSAACNAEDVISIGQDYLSPLPAVCD